MPRRAINLTLNTQDGRRQQHRFARTSSGALTTGHAPPDDGFWLMPLPYIAVTGSPDADELDGRCRRRTPPVEEDDVSQTPHYMGD